jgi:hypothetical protein
VPPRTWRDSSFPRPTRSIRSGAMTHVTIAWPASYPFRLRPRYLSVSVTSGEHSREIVCRQPPQGHSLTFDQPLMKCYKSTTSERRVPSFQGPCPRVEHVVTLGVCDFKFQSHPQNGALLQSGKLLPARQAITRHTGVPEKDAQRRYAVNFENSFVLTEEC